MGYAPSRAVLLVEIAQEGDGLKPQIALQAVGIFEDDEADVLAGAHILLVPLAVRPRFVVIDELMKGRQRADVDGIGAARLLSLVI